MKRSSAEYGPARILTGFSAQPEDRRKFWNVGLVITELVLREAWLSLDQGYEGDSLGELTYYVLKQFHKLHAPTS